MFNVLQSIKSLQSTLVGGKSTCQFGFQLIQFLHQSVKNLSGGSRRCDLVEDQLLLNIRDHFVVAFVVRSH